MCYTRVMRERLERLQSDVIEIAGEAMLENKEQIVALLTHQQYVEGVDNEGNPLPQYSLVYKTEKRRLTGRGDNTDLNLTGEFQQEMNLAVDGEQYYFESPATTDDGQLKSDWLNAWSEKKGGANVMLLTPDNQQRIYPIIRPDFERKCNERLALD